MSSSEPWFSINDFFLGIVNDKQSDKVGASLNLEEVDIFENKNYMKADWGMNSTYSSDITPVYDFSDNKQDGDFWAYGSTYVDIGGFDPTGTTIGSIGTDRSQSTSDENTARPNTEITAYETTEDSDLTTYTEWVYFTAGDDGGLPTLERYNITDDNAPSSVDSDLGEGTGDHIPNEDAPVVMRNVNGELYILFSNTINKVTTDGTYTKRAEVLPPTFECVDLTSGGRQSESMFVLCQALEDTRNKSRGYWIDLANLEIQDYIDLPYAGAQWVENIGSDIIMSFVESGVFRTMALSQPFPGATAQKLPNIKLNNILEPQTSVFDDTKTNDLEIKPSPSKSVHTQDGQIHFLLNKDDQPGIYSIGRIDSDTDYGIRLEHKLPGSYPDQLGLAMGVYGNKKIVSYIDGYDGTAGSGTETFAVVEPDDSNTTRSDNAVYESVWFTLEKPLSDKQLQSVQVITEPLPANTEVRVYAAKDFQDSYSHLTQPDGSNMDETNSSYAEFEATPIKDAKTIRIKIEIDGDGNNTPKVSSVGMKVYSDNYPAHE